MNLVEFLNHLSAQDVELWIHGDSLRYRAPKDVLTPTLLTKIKQHKAEILKLLREGIHTSRSYPLSHGQQGLWFLYQLAPESAAYNLAFTARICSDVDIPALQRAFQALIDRHATLRTTFSKQSSGPTQEIHAYQEVCFQETDASTWNWHELTKKVVEVYQRPFNLERGPVLRVSLFTRSVQEHILLLTIHHIAHDGWSLWVLLDELRLLYSAEKASRAISLPPLKYKYTDYVQWQNEMLASSVGEELWTYWQKQLAGELPVLNLLTDRPRPPLQTYQGASHAFKLTKELTQQLKRLAQAEGATLYMTLLAVFQVLLHRYTGQEDILVGSPTAGRSQTEFAGIVGYFVNLAVLRANLSDNPTFKAFLSQVRYTVMDAIAHQDYPFPLLVEKLQPNRDSSRSPIFQVSFVLQKPQSGEIAALLVPGETEIKINWGELKLEPFEMAQQEGQFDLTLDMVEAKDSLFGVFNYNTDLFDATTISRMAEHFQTLLLAIVANPQQHLKDLPLNSVAQRHKLLVEWNSTFAEYPQNKCIHQLFEQQVEKTPDAPAVVFLDALGATSRKVDQQLTYRELNCRANQLAHYLMTLGVGPDVLVGLCVERSLEMVVGLLGILKAGGAYVPLDPTYPKERLAYMLSDSQVSVLLTQQRLSLSFQANTVYLDTNWDIAQESEENPVSAVVADNLAYVLYTSGSTGKPKGVMIEHRAICNHMSWMQTTFPLTEADKVLQKTPFSFDASVWEFYAPLLVGAQLLMARQGGHQDSAYLVKVIAEQKVTTVQLVPSLLRMLLDQGGFETCNSLKRIFCGGEALPVALQERLQATLDTDLYNLYGPTEACIDATFWTCKRGHQQVVSIGRPISNTQIYILDSHLQPVPIGVPGELHIGGAGLARGYLKRPELTLEKFISNPFSNESRARLYKTGDLGRYLSDGNIEYLGRIDHQVKIRGFRIELGEIEAVLSQHPAVQETVVIDREDVSGHKRLVAYVVPDQEAPTINDLRFFLKEQLAEYMVPNAFVMLDALPLTPNGKVDRSLLPAPEMARPELKVTFCAPKTPIEEMLALIWADVLGVQQVGILDNFFELGGDSILSIQIIARASRAGLQLTPKQLFGHQTIAELAAVAGTTQAIRVEQGAVSGQLPLTPIQHWFFNQNLPYPAHWNQAILLEVPPDIDRAILERVVQHLLVHHDALRLRFEISNDWQQVNASSDDTVAFSLIDLSTLADFDQKAAMEAVASELQASLNLSQGPLVRVALFDLGARQSSRLLIVIHHLAVDGVSWRILLEDLQTSYQQLSQGKTIQLSPKTTSFKEWAQRLSKYARSDALELELAYWLTEPPMQVAQVPTDFAEGANNEISACTVSVSLNVEETCALLQEVPKTYNTQINDVLLTALVQVLAEWTGSSALLFNLEGHGRENILEDVDLSRTVGWFTTIFPVLLEVEATDNPGDALKSVKEQLRQIPNRGIGYGLLRYLSGNVEIASKLQGFPKPAVSFNYLGQFDQVLQTSTLFKPATESIGRTHSPLGNRSHLLEINGIIIGGCLQIDWTYSKNVHRNTTIETLAQEFVEVLRSLIDHCLSPESGGYTPSDFPEADLSQKDLDKLLAELGQS